MRRAVVLALVLASPALAQQEEPDVDALLAQARTGLQTADFAAADLALDRAEQASMSRAQLLEWLELRALVAYADQRLGALDETLRGYASLVPPSGPPPVAFPAPVRARLAELQARHEPIRLGAEVGAQGPTRAIMVAAQVIADPGHLVRRATVRAGADGEALHAIAPLEALTTPGDPHREVRVGYVVEAYGPGGALLVSLGTEDAPIRTVVRGVPFDDTPIIVGATIAGVVVALGVVAFVIAAIATDGFRDGSSTTVHGPTAPLLEF